MLDVLEQAADRPIEVPAEFAGIAVAPIRPRPFPRMVGAWFLFPWFVNRQSGGEEGPMVVGELEAVLALDAGEFGVCQPFLHLTTGELRQPPRSLCTQPETHLIDHHETVAPQLLAPGRSIVSAAGWP
ncbi:hypothetical protein AB0M50_03040 [Nonomuraea fuscirosea]|uniref:hypothetical protein n=1 Tax=Nonomuraea fuscirosea TaxID=1291556 RepID=UPI0034166FB6